LPPEVQAGGPWDEQTAHVLNHAPCHTLFAVPPVIPAKASAE
jgi:hypothetical protein